MAFGNSTNATFKTYWAKTCELTRWTPFCPRVWSHLGKSRRGHGTSIHREVSCPRRLVRNERDLNLSGERIQVRSCLRAENCEGSGKPRSGARKTCGILTPDGGSLIRTSLLPGPAPNSRSFPLGLLHQQQPISHRPLLALRRTAHHLAERPHGSRTPSIQIQRRRATQLEEVGSQLLKTHAYRQPRLTAIHQHEVEILVVPANGRSRMTLRPAPGRGRGRPRPR